jgi:ATP-dependent helicase HepA
MFCKVIGKESLGIGKIISSTSRTAVVDFFISPCDPPLRFEVPNKDAVKTDLSQETRVYVQNQRTGLWETGRVLVADDHKLRVQFPDRRIIELNSELVHVRCNLPIENPVSFLSRFINYTPRFSDSRRNFVKAVLDQRCACRGMSGLLSSVMELEAHQVRVVERVLTDPVQRYLLADEVGLGKTIEAGVIIRQYVLDSPDHFIVVVVPDHLVVQWRCELTQKFLLAHVLGLSVFVVGFHDVTLSSLLPAAKMLVVDEVHQLVKGIDLEKPESLYHELCAAAHQAERLLLVSATPVFGNEASFLAMLHLLDPLIYSLSDLDTFKAKIANRQPLSHLLAEFSPGNPFIEDATDKITAMFPADALLQQYGKRLMELLNEVEADEEDMVEAVGVIRSHVSETYRLHRRILRNRRNSVEGLTPKRIGLKTVTYRSEERRVAFCLLEQWRSAAALSVYQNEDGEAATALGEIFTLFLDAVFSSPHELHRLVERRLGGGGRDACLTIPLFQGERDILLSLKEIAVEFSRDGAKLEALRGLLQHLVQRRKAIVFCTFIETATAVAGSLENSFPGRVAMPQYSSDCSLDSFLEDPVFAILVCDRSAEEGLNLHKGNGEKVMIHYDLPLSPNRIEQRIGRLDRYGFHHDIRSYAVLCEDDAHEMEWCICLKEGFGIFDQSIATLQYLIEAEMAGLRRDLLVQGVEAVQSLTGKLSGESGLMVSELHKIELQDQLDAMQDEPMDAFDALVDVDCDWKGIQAQVDSWVNDGLLFEKIPHHIEGHLPPDRVFRFQYNHDRNRNTLVPLDRFMEKFLPVIDLKARGGGSAKPRSFPFSYRRETAIAKGLQLLRYGNPFMDGMMDFISQDDRGKCFAMWRHVPSYIPFEMVDHFFRFDFMVEVNLDFALEVAREKNLPNLKTIEKALRRQGDIAMPPLYHSVWLDAEFEVPKEDLVRKYLEIPYNNNEQRSDGSRDWNIKNELWDKVWEQDLPVFKRWQEVCSDARSAALALLRKTTNLDQELHRVLENMDRHDEVHFAQRRSRLSLFSAKEREFEEQELETEILLRDALRHGIANPRIFLDSVGAVFLSNFSPFG